MVSKQPWCVPHREGHTGRLERLWVANVPAAKSRPRNGVDTSRRGEVADDQQVYLSLPPAG